MKILEVQKPWIRSPIKGFHRNQ